jgi:hypothetical protein
MRSYLLQVLMLGCSLLLVLPPGWCCLAAGLVSRKEAAKTAPCCRSCCADKAPPAAPAPCPHKPGKCPCGERNGTPPNAVKAFLDGLPAIASFSMLDRTPFALKEGDWIALPSLPFFASPHLLNCVWLC